MSLGKFDIVAVIFWGEGYKSFYSEKVLFDELSQKHLIDEGRINIEYDPDVIRINNSLDWYYRYKSCRIKYFLSLSRVMRHKKFKRLINRRMGL